MAPTPEFTAGIVLERLVEFANSALIFSVITIMDSALPNYATSKYLQGARVKWIPKPVEDWSLFAKSPKFLTKIGEYLSRVDSHNVLYAIQREISREKPDHLLLVIQGQTSIKLFLDLQKLGIPSTFVHWDDWSWWSRAKSLSKKQDAITKKQLSQIAEIGNHITPTEQFQKNLEIPKQRAVVLFPSFTEKCFDEPKINDNNIHVAFAGQNYAKIETERFLAALDSVGWEIKGKKVVLHHYGKNPISKSHVGSTIIEEGWYQFRFLPKAISSFDLAFLPYPQSEEMKIISRTSFPSKLATYISAGLPVLYLGDLDSFTAQLVSKIGIALNCNERNNKIIDSITDLVSNSKERRFERVELFHNFFSESKFRDTLTNWLEMAGLSHKDFVLEKTYPIGNGKLIRNFDKICDKPYRSILYFQIFLIILNPKILVTKINIKLMRKVHKIVYKTLRIVRFR
jgi:hypothetical protein